MSWWQENTPNDSASERIEPLVEFDIRDMEDMPDGFREDREDQEFLGWSLD